MKRYLSKTYWDEARMERFIGSFLRFNVFLSCGITLLGGIIFFIQHPFAKVDYSPIPEGEYFKGVDFNLRYLNTILDGVLSFDGASIIQLGVIVLIATPILRVLISFFSFLIERDYLYMFITLIVFIIILSNMILGIH